MKRTSLRVLPLALLLSLPITASASTDETCRALLDPMTTIMATMRRDVPLTDAQQAQWRTWNTTCTARTWQAALKDPSLPPIAAHKLIGGKSLAPSKKPRWDLVVTPLPQELARSGAYPRTTCTTSYTSHQWGGSSSTTCTTY